MKRSISILLLLVFTYSFIGGYITFHVQRHYLRKEIKTRIKQGVPENELALIIVTDDNSSELEWEHSKEFHYRGTMYDVVRKEIQKDGSIYYHCVTDHQETKLFEHLDELLALAIAKKEKASHRIKGSFKSICVYLPPQQEPFALHILSEIFNVAYLYGYQSPVLESNTPPPRIS